MALIISLTIIGILLIIAEILLIPGIFVTGLLGLLALAASCWFAFDDYGQTAGFITLAANVILAIASTVLCLRSKTWNKLSLQTEIDSRADTAPADKGIKEGMEGVTVTRLNPMGKVLFGDITAECTARNGIIDSRQEVVVTLIEDNRIYVKPK